MGAAAVDVLIAGAGYVGSALASELVARGRTVAALRRRAGLLPDTAGVVGLAGDAREPASIDLPARVGALVAALSPDERTAASYAFAFGAGPAGIVDELVRRGAAPARVVLVSSTGAFASRGGAWIDEDGADERDDPVQRAIVDGERAVAAAAERAGASFVAARLAGIYGPGRERLVDDVAAGRATFDPTRDEWTNRIHVEDAARALAHLVGLASPSSRWIVADSEPARRRDVLAFVAERMGAPPPLARAMPTTDRGGGRGEKRLSCARLLTSGFALRYPTYREGYGALIAARSAQS